MKTRVLTEYHERLGGPWTPKGKKAVADWLQNLLVLRHRVAHTGYLPSYEEAFGAGEAYHTLAKQLRNRLAAQAKKYPFAAGLLVTSGGFERRGIRSKAATSAIKTNTPEAVKKFIEWRTEFIRRRS